MKTIQVVIKKVFFVNEVTTQKSWSRTLIKYEVHNFKTGPLAGSIKALVLETKGV